MAYVVFARKYRPQTFDEVVGQDHITKTLKNAIELDRVAHAYLFTGPRGIGKTTTARILAKALNCEKGPTPAPCNVCPSCVDITAGSSLDILEIDGASNTGVDDVRTLREDVKFSPSKGRFKVFIIDEIHMLSPGAFNALLKTLEEPPPHVKFIFATTQAQKLPATILSRCQRFDFRRIPVVEMALHLKGIAKKEGLEVTDGALQLISSFADGSMRDAEVMLDQIASSAAGEVAEADVARVLGVVDAEALFLLGDHIGRREARAALTVVNDLIALGKDPAQLLVNAIEHFRNLLVAKTANGEPLKGEITEEKVKRLIGSAAVFTAEDILYCLYVFSNALDMVRRTTLSRIPLEVAVVKLCSRSSIHSLDEIAERVKALEAKLGGCASPGAASVTAEPAVRPALPIAAVPKGPSPEELPPAPTESEASGEEGALFASDPSAPKGASNPELQAIWRSVIETVRSKKISVASYLAEGTPSIVAGTTLLISFPREFKFHKEGLESSSENVALIEEALAAAAGMKYRVRFDLIENGRSKASGSNGQKSGTGTDGGGARGIPQKVDPIIDDAIDIFGGDIVSRERNTSRGRP